MPSKAESQVAALSVIAVRSFSAPHELAEDRERRLVQPISWGHKPAALADTGAWCAGPRPVPALPTARSPLTATDLPPGPDAATWANVGACRAFRWAFPALTALAGGLAGPGTCGAGPPHAWSVVPGGVSRRSWSGRFVPPFSCCGGPVSPSRRIPVALGGQGPPRGRKGDARDPGWVMSADGDGCEWRPACFCVPLGARVAHDRRLRSPTWLGRGWGLFSLPSGAVRGPRDVP